MKKSIVLITLMQILMWTIFSIFDYIEETTQNEFTFAFCIVFPILITVIYLMFEKGIQKNLKASKLKNTLLFLGIWCLETIVFTIIIIILMNNNLWLVHQSIGGLENFLNGIEYPVMGFMSIVIPIGIFAVWNLILWGYNAIKKKTGK